MLLLLLLFWACSCVVVVVQQCVVVIGHSTAVCTTKAFDAREIISRRVLL